MMSDIKLPPGWALQDPKNGWNSDVFAGGGHWALKDGINWVHRSPTGVATIQCKDSLDECLQVLRAIEAAV